jgi:hypothetical protein
MLRFLARTAGLLLFAGSFIALVADGIRSLAAKALVTTPLAATLSEVAPDLVPDLRAMVEGRLHPYLWDPVTTTVLAWPAFAVGGVAGMVLILAGARRRRAASVLRTI